MTAPTMLITGATGYLGEPVFAELVSRGIAVTALVRKENGLTPCCTVKGDLATVGSLPEVAMADGIIHLASSRTSNPSIVLRDDILGTASLLDAWQSGPFVYVSSPVVHAESKEWLTEDSPLRPVYWYDLGKLANELQVRLASTAEPRGPVTILRPAPVFHSNQRRHDGHLLGDVFAHCERSGRFVFDSDQGLEGYGSSFIGGADFGRAVADALSITNSGPYLVAGGFCTWRELVETINRIAGTHADFVVRPDAQPRPGEFGLPQSRTELDTTAFTRATAFVPRQSLEELIEEFVRAERSAELVRT